MKTFWRISGYRDLSGEGGRIAAARWHTEGRPIVYLAETPAGAMLERLVHLSDRDGKLPRTYDLLEVQAQETVAVSNLGPAGETQWRLNLEITRGLGDNWLAAGDTALARVPSAIVPRTWNYLLNPEHADAVLVTIASVMRERFDPRLFRFGVR